jgi:hypothetical protein
MAGAAKVEAWPHQRSGTPGQHRRAHCEQRDRRPHQCPHAKAGERPRERRRRTRQRGGDIGGRLPPELHLPAEQRIGQRGKGGDAIDQRLHAQQLRDFGLAVIGGGDRREDQLHDRERPVQRDQHPEQLPRLMRRHVVALDQPARQAVAVEHVEEHQHDRGHRVQAVIAWIEDPDDQEGRRPLYRLGENLAARSPQNRASHLILK